LRSLQFVRHISGQATGTQLPHISGTDVGAVLIPIPPLAEQAVIAERCDDALRALAGRAAACTAMVDQQESLDRAILAKAFLGELVPQDLNDEPAEAMLARLRGANGVAKPPPKRR
jgi:type I restriction enzyme S subunit